MSGWSARVIFCDDIRQEYNGKVIVIGIYQGSLSTTKFPLAVSLATYVDIRGISAGPHKFSILAQYETEDGITVLGDLPMEVEVRSGDLPVILQGGGMALHAEKKGKLLIRLSVDGAPHELIDTLVVSMGPESG